MKTKLSLIAAVAAVLGAPATYAQEDRPPQPPASPAPSVERPPAPPQEGVRPAPEADGQRGPGPHGGPRPRPEKERGPGGPDGERGPGRPGDSDSARGDKPRPGGPDSGRRPDGERGFPKRGEPGNREDGPRGRSAERPQKLTPYIGVITSAVPPSLGSQLGLAEGFGVVVDEVVPDSPAATAGVQRFDVLKQLDDQQLIGPDQLAVLIRSYGKDREASLTLLRKGQEQKLTLKVGERLLPDRRASNAPFPGEFHSRMDALRERGSETFRRFQDDAREFQDRTRDFQKKIEIWRKQPGDGPAPEPPQPPPPRRSDSPADRPPSAPSEGPGKPDGLQPPALPEPPRPGDLLREVRPGGAPQVRIDQDGEVTTWNTAQARIVVKDDNGEVEVRSENGHRSVVAKNPAGETVFTGPVDTEEQRRALPPPVRGILDRVQKQRFGPEGRGVVIGGGPEGSAERSSSAPGASAPREIQ